MKICLRTTFFLAGALIAVSSANADVISGNFTGVAVNVRSRPWELQEGAALLGSFSLDTGFSFERISSDGISSAVFFYNGVQNSPVPVPPSPYRFTAYAPSLGTSYHFAHLRTYVRLFQESSGQRIEIASDSPGSCCASLLTLVGPNGGLFSSLDVAGITLSQIDVESSSAWDGFRDFIFTVDFTRFDVAIAQVPEPASGGLVSVPLALLAALGLIRRRRAGV